MNKRRWLLAVILFAISYSLLTASAFAQKPKYPYSHGFFSSINDRTIYAAAYNGATTAAQVNAAATANLGACLIIIGPEMSGTNGNFVGMVLPNNTYLIQDERNGLLSWGQWNGAAVVPYSPGGGGGTPGGAANSIQYNNAGAFGGFGSWDGSTLTIPNGASAGITFGAANGRVTGSGGGYLNFDGSGAPSLTAGGTNQNITLMPSGTGKVIVAGTSGLQVGTPSAFNFNISGNASMTGDVNFIGPASQPSAGYLHLDASGNMTTAAYTGINTTIAGLGSYAVKGNVVSVTDGMSATDCTTGGGSTAVACQYSGTAWAALGGGGGGAATDLSNLANPTNINLTTLTAAGAIGLTAGGTNQNVTLAPSGTGTVMLNSSSLSSNGTLAIKSAAGTNILIEPNNGTTGTTEYIYLLQTIRHRLQTQSCTGACTIQVSEGDIVPTTLTGNVTSCTINGAQSGYQITFDFIEDATGGRTLTCAALPNLGTITTTAGEHNVQQFYYDGTTWQATDAMFNHP